MDRPMFNGPLAIVAGPPRSGTTWLNREICDRPGWGTLLPECTLLTQQIALYNRTHLFCDAARFGAYFGTKAALRALYHGITAEMLGLIADINHLNSADVLVLKDPELSLYLDDLDDLLPAHKLVCLVRDPRDVIASMKKVALRKAEVWDARKTSEWVFRYYWGIQNFAQNAGPNAVFVRYEDAVAGGLDGVRDFLGQDRAPFVATQGDYASVKSSLDRKDPFFSDLYLKPTSQEAVGSYKRLLVSAEIKVIEHMYSSLMAKWGYK